jgi:subtilisin family serine protease
VGFIRPFVIILALSFSISVGAQEYVPGELIVKMKDQRASGASRFLGKASTRSKMSLKKSWSQFNIHQFQLKPGVSVEQAINDLHFDEEVEYAEPNYILKKHSPGIEGAPMTFSELQQDLEANSEEWDSFGAAERFGQTGADIRVEEAWSILGNSTQKPIVAVIDSGVDYDHYVFRESGAIWVNPGEIPDNSIDDDNNGYVDDVYGWNFVNNSNDPMDDDNHGTHVAGIVLGITQDILRMEGEISPSRIQIMPVKFLDHNGSGTTANAIAAIHYAMNNGAHVLNNSWGGGHFSQALYDVIDQSNKLNISFVAAAGNAANDNDATPTYPASYKIANVVSIAATSTFDGLASFSNFGNQSVHVASPGISVVSTLPNGTFGHSSGTSMAAPFVAGLSALMLREKSAITGHQIKGVLYDNSFTVGDLAGKVASQARIDAYEAVHFVKTTDMSSYQPNLAADRWLTSVDSPSGGTAASGGCGMVARQVFRSGQGGGSSNPFGGGGAMPMLMLALLMAPLVLINILKIRRRNTIESRRQHPRFQVQSEVSIAVGETRLVGNMSSLSMGGACINTDALLEKGGLVTLSIATPDGKEHLEVKGQVVWSEEKKAYGVKFMETSSEALNQISAWTQDLGLKKSS